MVLMKVTRLGKNRSTEKRSQPMSMPVMPIPRNGTCPSGYSPHGEMCVPRPGSKPVILKNGNCPPGWSPQGNYCIAQSNNPKMVVPKNGVCPPGYASIGHYFVQI
jgi:hypothetical protein